MENTFIELHHENGNAMLINVQKIMYITKWEDGCCAVSFSNTHFIKPKETFVEVASLLNIEVGLQKK